MVIGPFGVSGVRVISRVLAAKRFDVVSAIIRLLATVDAIAAEVRRECDYATRSRVHQVIRRVVYRTFRG